MSGEVKIEKENLKNAIKVFLFFVLIAEILNILIYNLDILNGETFNMFYISPYFISTLPVFNVIQQAVPFVIYLFTYILVMVIGAVIVYYISKLINKNSKKTIKKYKKIKKTIAK